MEHTWQFFRAGGVDQVAIRNGADLAHLDELDQKLWVALACPTRGVEIDARTLDLIDTDQDGRIRPPELIAACRWACAQLRDADDLIAGGDSLPLASFADATETGTALGVEAARILELLGRKDDTTLTLEDVSDRSRLIAAMRFNGDGIVTVKTSDDAAIQTVIQHIIDTQGGVRDLGGEMGIDRDRADVFFTHAAALRDWQHKIRGDAAVLPFGEATGAAVTALEAVRGKVDDFFARCRLAAYDARATAEMNPSPERYRDIAALTLSLAAPAISELPLAPVAADVCLPLLSESVNPAWAQAVRVFQQKCAAPLFGADVAMLGEAQWTALQTLLQPYRQWLATRPATSLDTIALEDIVAIAEGDARDVVNALIDEDKEIEPHNARIVELEKLLRFKRDLLRLVHNFVSFKEFYRREGAIFEAGTLFLDGRSCDLTIQVSDMAKHAALAGLAKACLAYCECRRQGKKMTIVAAFTAGDTDFLFVGRNGIFYDRSGDDWDATIIKMIDNPTNVGQAFLSPYKKFIRAIEEQVAKRAAASDTTVQNGLGSLASGIAATGTANAAAAAPAPVQAPGPRRIDVGTVAALGVALGSISAVLVGLFGKFIELGWWIPVALLGIMMAISGPSMVVAWLKLRERSLGPILDASGWAINGRMKVNVRLGGLLSKTARIPLNALALNDPYAKSNRGRYAVAVAIVVAVVAITGWRFGWVDRYLPAQAHFAAVEAWLKAVS
ncbi:hypothetical protein OVY01_20075 [Robbsia sp. Bb-Pol-6]|uniref:EF-hand domain-containing protein n=1 Tax=Robbsia betulipollinis TaxID=2981849 RepID=A0ABT3ZT51_9BURK|nr:hypothetical protein [Robbsia betulipollinis]MCY0389447.1 hypothetical protein [Robbsia betulipollinis]